LGKSSLTRLTSAVFIFWPLICRKISYKAHTGQATKKTDGAI